MYIYIYIYIYICIWGPVVCFCEQNMVGLSPQHLSKTKYVTIIVSYASAKARAPYYSARVESFGTRAPYYSARAEEYGSRAPYYSARAE